MSIFNSDSKFMSVLTNIIDVVLLSLLWLLFSITIVGFGPATTALYYTIAKTVRRGRGTLLKEFWRSLKENWWKAMVFGLLTVVIGFYLALTDGITVIGSLAEGGLSSLGEVILPMLRLLIFFSINTYIFPVLSRFDLKFVRILGMSISLFVRHLWLTLVMMSVGFVIIFFVSRDWFWIIFFPGVYYYLVSYPMEFILKKYTPKPENPDDKTIDYWYLE